MHPRAGARAARVLSDVPNVTDRVTLADRIEDLLPQTQCTKCGYAGCRPYAEAVAQGQAGYNQCPPGGAQGVARLAALLGKPVIALNPENGEERPRPLAVIDERLCIGCTLCLQACPVDAIELTHVYDIVGLTRQEMIFDKEKLLRVYDETVKEEPM